MTTDIDIAITNYLPLLSNAQKQAILTVMKTFTQELRDEAYSEEYINELNSRFAAYESNSIPTYNLEETENRARATYQAKKRT